jgi:hypothetical protein
MQVVAIGRKYNMSLPNCVPQEIYEPDEDNTEWLEDEWVKDTEEKEIEQSAKEANYILD